MPNLLRRPVWAFACALLLGTLGATAQATDYQLADGRVHFDVPVSWPQIMMQTSGNPQFMAFQVPDSFPVGQRVLARATVTVEHMDNAAAFRQWVHKSLLRAHQMPGYQALAGSADDTVVRYKAVESGVPMRYSERYFLKGNDGVQLRCLRPERSQVDDAWVNTFERGCNQIAASLQGR